MKVFILILYNVERCSQQLKTFFGIGNLYARKKFFKQRIRGLKKKKGLLPTQASTIPPDNHWNQITMYPYKDSILQACSSINAHTCANLTQRVAYHTHYP